MMLRLSLLLLLLSRSAYSTLLGWVESPGYPTGYLPHASLNWSRCAPKGHTLSIKLIHLDLEDSHDCENDAVKVFSNGNLIAVLCGKREFEELESSVNPLLHSTSGGCLTLTFHSDYSNIKRHTGFRGFYTDQDFDECEHDDPDNKCTQFCHNYIGGYHCSCRHGYYLDADKHTCTVSCTKDLSGLREGDISTPSWPSSYAENANCQYTLSVEDTLQLELHFSQDFDVEQSDGQCIDALRIETPSGSLGPFCGKTPPPSPLLTYSHHVQIHFTSDGYGTNKGFTLHFKTTEKVCQAVVTPHSTLTPQKPEYSPGETGTVTCELGYVANTQGTQTLISEYTTTCQITGVWTPTYVCESVDCGFPDIPEDGILELVDSDDRHTLYKDQIHFNCSSKYYTLEGDDTYTCSASGEWVSDGGKKEMPKCIEVCGKPEKLSTSVGRIMGGKDAKMGQIPWQLLIKEPSRGGASLINDRWAVTAAHVVENIQDTALRLYGGLIDGRNADQSPSVVMDSEKIIIHPGYIKGAEEPTNFDNDIALIRLASRVDLGPNLLPICLPEPNRGLVEDEQGTVSGWGTMGRRGASPTLKYAQVGVKSLTECQNTPFTPKTNKRMIFTNNMFCAGGEGTDSCEKDSGGPFVTPMLAEGIDRYYLTGIVSWGAPCREKQYKGYYTKVENYVDWIKNTINTIETS